MWRSMEEKIPVEGENLRLVRSLAEEYFRTHTGPECWEAARALYVSPHFQVQEAGVFLRLAGPGATGGPDFPAGYRQRPRELEGAGGAGHGLRRLLQGDGV